MSESSIPCHWPLSLGRTQFNQEAIMDTLWTVVSLAGIVIAIYVLIRILAAPIKWIFKLVLNACAGFLLLFIVNFIGSFFSFSIPVNFITCVISGAFGIPGVIFLAVIILFVL